MRAWLICAVFLFCCAASLAHFWRAQNAWWLSILRYHIVRSDAVLLEAGDTGAASAWRSACLMYGLDIKRSQWAWEEVNHCLRNEVKRIRPTWRRNSEKRVGGGGGGDNTIMMKAVGFHFILSSHVRMNLQNDIRGQLEYEQFVWAQTVLAVCEGRPCPYTFILSDEWLMRIPAPYLQRTGRLVLLTWTHTQTLSSIQLINRLQKTCAD